MEESVGLILIWLIYREQVNKELIIERSNTKDLLEERDKLLNGLKRQMDNLMTEHDKIITNGEQASEGIA